MNADSGIVIEKLSKRYGRADQLALNKLSLQVNGGEVYGFLGPNGAGKSTTIRLLMNFIQPSGGQASILGLDAVKDSVKVKKIVGYLSGDFAAYPKMTGQQFVDYLGELQGGVSSKFTTDLARRLNADLMKQFRDLSRGNRQKIGIVQAFMHQPKVLILDEPTSGLDPLIQEVFYELLTEAKQRGASVFVSSHVLSEVQKMCDRVGIIRGGKLIAERNIAEMAQDAAQTFDITFSGKVPLTEIKRLSGVKIVSHDGQSITIHVHGDLSLLFGVLARTKVQKMDVRSLDLEETFMHFYKDEDKKL